jgi:hypothetical protein
MVSRRVLFLAWPRLIPFDGPYHVAGIKEEAQGGDFGSAGEYPLRPSNLVYQLPRSNIGGKNPTSKACWEYIVGRSHEMRMNKVERDEPRGPRGWIKIDAQGSARLLSHGHAYPKCHRGEIHSKKKLIRPQSFSRTWYNIWLVSFIASKTWE